MNLIISKSLTAWAKTAKAKWECNIIDAAARIHSWNVSVNISFSGDGTQYLVGVRGMDLEMSFCLFLQINNIIHCQQKNTSPVVWILPDVVYILF